MSFLEINKLFEVKLICFYLIGAQFVEAPTNLEIVTINSRAVRVTWRAPVTSQLIAGYKVRFWPRGNLSQSSLTISSDRL